VPDALPVVKGTLDVLVLKALSWGPMHGFEVTTWLYRIAVNTAKNYLAAQRRRPMDVELDLQDPEQFDLHAKLKEVDTPEGVTLSRELHETVERAIEALPDDLRTAIVLRELDGMSYEEIAQTMDCPVGTVRSRIFRARDAISKKIGNLAD
jgi:RNA polymerase sigma-70 factor (ECF subfamily)